jgi:hypothetical protein
MKEEQIRKEYEALRTKLAKLGYICSGSVMLLYRKCGKRTCACRNDEKSEHGPYYIWTRKVLGKTVTRTLTEKQARRCQQYIENLKALEPILSQMKDLAAQTVEQD